MPTEKPRVTITVSEDQLREIEEFRYGNKMKNQTQAILSLVRVGLDELAKGEVQAIEKAPEAAEAATRADKDISAFKAVLERANIMKPGRDISKSDLDFLRAMFLALKAHFQQGKEERE